MGSRGNRNAPLVPVRNFLSESGADVENIHGSVGYPGAARITHHPSQTRRCELCRGMLGQQKNCQRQNSEHGNRRSRVGASHWQHLGLLRDRTARCDRNARRDIGFVAGAWHLYECAAGLSRSFVPQFVAMNKLVHEGRLCAALDDCTQSQGLVLETPAWYHSATCATVFQSCSRRRRCSRHCRSSHRGPAGHDGSDVQRETSRRSSTNNCVSCHRPGEAAPMSLLTYEQARPLRKSDRKRRDESHDAAVACGRAGRHVSQRAHPVGCGAGDTDVVGRGRRTQGDAKDLPPQPPFTEGWSLGKPDVVLEMAEDYRIPASEERSSTSGSTCRRTSPNRSGSSQSRSGQAIGRPSTTCSSTTGQSPRETRIADCASESRRSVETPDPHDRAPTAAAHRSERTCRRGSSQRTHPARIRRWRPKARHSASNPAASSSCRCTTPPTAGGRPIGQKSASRSRPSRHRARSGPALLQRHVEVAGARGRRRSQHRSRVFAGCDRVGTLPAHASTRQEMGIRAPAAEWRDRNPSLPVPRYDFNWQTYYMFKEPLQVPKGSKIVSTAWYDNSAANRNNPNPNVDVLWGDQTWEEMQYTGILVSAR